MIGLYMFRSINIGIIKGNALFMDILLVSFYFYFYSKLELYLWSNGFKNKLVF